MKSQLPAHWSETPLVQIISPLEDFLRRSTSQGLILLGVTAVAVLIANSPLAESYQHILHAYIGISIGSFELKETLLHWINDGLMAVFFLLIGLEIKREVLIGELSNIRAALLPIGAAVGGAVIPALFYIVLTAQSGSTNGWGIPMATDIAFTLGILALLGSRIPISLKVFVTAAAIIDDLIAVLVIAFFYSSGINVGALAIGFGLLAVLVLFNISGIRNLSLYLALGILVWFAFLQSGVHATIAGVLVALTIPARNRMESPAFWAKIHDLLHRFENHELESSHVTTGEIEQAVIIELEHVIEQVQAPLQKLEHALHNISAFVIMPIFAFANAGVLISLDKVNGSSLPLALGIVVGLVIGKPIGVLGATWLMQRVGIAPLPKDVGWPHMIGVACLTGIGFTMSLFVASLAFTDAQTLDIAKLAILVASLIAGTLGYILLRRA